MSDIFEEAKEDARIEQLIRFWRSYNTYIIAGVVAFIIILSGYSAWQYMNEKRQLEAAHLYEEIFSLVDAKKNDEAKELLDKLLDKSQGYGILAELKMANIESKEKQVPSELYEKIINNKKADEKFRELAIVLSTLHDLKQNSSQKVIDKLEPIASSNSPFKFLATELMAVTFLKEGQKEKALEFFKALGQDEGTTPGIRARATAMIQQLTNF
jgi:hypothetical protein